MFVIFIFDLASVIIKGTCCIKQNRRQENVDFQKMNLYNYRSATENIYNLSLIQLSNLFVCDKKGGKKL